MSGGKAPKTTTQYVESSTSSLPKYAEPYYTSMMGQAQALTAQPYTPYGGERIAGFTPQQQQVQQQVLGQQTPGQFGVASGLGTAAGLGSLMASQYDPNQFSAQGVGAGPVNYFQMAGPGSFTQPGAAGSYMSPFIQQALEPQMREAVRSAQRGQLAEDLGAARQGTYGGSRQLLASLERERTLGQQLGDIQSRGMQSAYEQAQQQFNAEQQAMQGARQANLQAALGIQELGTQSGLQAALANQQVGLEAQRLSEQSRQFGAQQGLAGLAQAGQMAQTLGNLGQMQGQTDLARLSQQQGTAAQEQALQQQYLDTQYQDFLRQQNYPFEQLQKYSSLLASTPIQPNTTQTVSTPSPSLASQIMQAGLGGLSMARMTGAI
jgi:hypothetical protein